MMKDVSSQQVQLSSRIWLIPALLVAICSFAFNPNDHNAILDDAPEIKHEKPIDEEDPYFLLTGEADNALAEGDYGTAILRLIDAIRMDQDNPSNALLLSNLGYAYSCLDQDSLALNAYNEALMIAPSMSTVKCNRGLLYVKMGKEKQALDDFAMVLNRNPENATALYYHGMISLYSGDEQSAASDFQALEKITPDSYNATVAMATLYSLTNRDALAIPYYEKLIEEDPSPEYYSALAGCLLATDNLSEAGTIIAEGLGMYPNDPELYYYRAMLRHESFDIDGAKEDAKKAVRLGANPLRVAEIFK